MDTGFDPRPELPMQVVHLDDALRVLTQIQGVAGADYHYGSVAYPAHLDLYLPGNRTLRILPSAGGGLQFRANFTP